LVEPIINQAAIAAQATGIIDQAIFYFSILILLALIIAGIIFFRYMIQYKHKIRIRELTGTKKLIVDDLAREYKDDDGVEWWKLLKRKHLMPKPPDDCIELTNKGRKCVEAYYTENGEYLFLRDKNPDRKYLRNIGAKEIYGNFPKINKIKKFRGVYSFITDAHDNVESFDYISTPQKQIWVSQAKKAFMRKKKDWKEMLVPIVAISMFAMVLVAAMIFWGEIMKPFIDMGGKLTEVSENLKETSRYFRDAQLGKQSVEGTQIIGEVAPAG